MAGEVYREFLEKLKDRLIDAAEKTNTEFGPLMTVADLSIMVLVDMSLKDGVPDFEKFQAMIQIYQARIEQNIGKEIERRMS